MRPDSSMLTRRSIIVGAALFFVGCAGNESSGGEETTDDENDGANDTDSPNGESDGEQPEADDTDEAGSENGNPARGELTDMGDLTLTSPAFADGERIPEQYGYDAENMNPPLGIANIPKAAETLALVVDDPDAVEPAGKVWDHWIVWNVPTDLTTIPEGWDPDDATEGTNDFGEVGYGGPSPPDTEHRYRFKLFALDTDLGLPTETDADALGSAMEGHILEQTQLDGTYPA